MPQPPLRITPELLARYDIAGPRYTSYPTADRFGPAFSESHYIAALAQRRHAKVAQPLSLYVHIPFCESLCYFCACNKIITKHHELGGQYLRTLQKEIDLHVAHLGTGSAVSQLHLGGGSPTFLSDDELAQLMQFIRQAFTLQEGGEYSIEVDPRTVNAQRLAHLRQLGFNRISFGVQDFDANVQQAVHRIQPLEKVEALMHAARRIGFDSVNMDLIYGLPKQTQASFATTLAQVARLRPDRIALYAYAHLPERFKSQRRIDDHALPAASEKVQMLAQSLQAFSDAGYVYVGMDHFALPHDALAVAKEQGRLHRNFQGYSTQPDCDLLALGVSAIGRVGASYSQNAKTVQEYEQAIHAGHFAVVRGLALTRDDEIRRAVIMAIMCQGQVDFAQINSAWDVAFGDYFAHEMGQLETLQTQGMVEITQNVLTVTQQGWYFVRAVAMVFDHHLQAARSQAKFSKIL